MPKRQAMRQPLAEVFGFAIDDFSVEAMRYRKNKLCPFNNKIPNCTKDKAENPLGVCSIYDDDNNVVITCPIRFRQDWLLAEDAAQFFFSPDTSWTSFTEVRIDDKYGRSAGNIDIVLVAYDQGGRVIDFGALEIQSVYISGNIRKAFEYYMGNPEKNAFMDWSGQRHYPRPDFLSSSRKRLAPQLIYKGGILHAWRKKVAIAVDRHFFATLPTIDEVERQDAEMAWLVYDLEQDAKLGRYHLTRYKTVYTGFTSAVEKITIAEPGKVQDFVDGLQARLDEKLGSIFSSEAPTLLDILENYSDET